MIKLLASLLILFPVNDKAICGGYIYVRDKSQPTKTKQYPYLGCYFSKQCNEFHFTLWTSDRLELPWAIALGEDGPRFQYAEFKKSVKPAQSPVQ